MIRVFVVEDHPDLLEDLVFGLNAEGLTARGAADGRQLDALCAEDWPDVVILDVILPGEDDGLTIARRMRAHPGIGIIMLTSCGGIDDRVAGLDHADAYLVKPIDIRELAAVVRSVDRRASHYRTGEKDGTWTLHESRLELVSPAGATLHLTYRESCVLAVLAKAQGKVAPLKLLADALGESWVTFEKNRLELVFTRLRHKIAAVMTDPINPIKAARNAGYLLTIRIEVIDNGGHSLG